jgi:hypothetical protein
VLCQSSHSDQSQTSRSHLPLSVSVDGVGPRPESTALVPRSALLAAATARSKAVKDSADSITTLTGASAHSLGDRMALATTRWSFRSGDSITTLVSDFLLGLPTCREPTSLTTCSDDPAFRWRDERAANQCALMPPWERSILPMTGSSRGAPVMGDLHWAAD